MMQPNKRSNKRNETNKDKTKQSETKQSKTKESKTKAIGASEKTGEAFKNKRQAQSQRRVKEQDDTGQPTYQQPTSKSCKAIMQKFKERNQHAEVNASQQTNDGKQPHH